ncbi:MAG: L-arabinose ABC transporter ATP-binding protein AraG [Methylobacteriaceae bacterium]|jgi:L-arabinose transport system ATP-binding protein|nr:L-arabinose ABC transporter ATP-binding protein AraG [Methylobacteriaceae bacterium]
MAEAKQPYLEFRNIGKRFAGVTALRDISFGCAEGEIHALMGENGAGKSTLLKILAGNYEPTTGELYIAGEPKKFLSSVDALEAGVAIIYQELHLLTEASIAENIYLGQLPRHAGFIDWHTLYRNTRTQLKNLELDIDPKTQLKYLPIGQRQMIEIAKALTRNAKIIAFDEPTSSLSAREIKRLFEVIKELKAAGKVIIYVSHRMEEIFQIADKITVFKDGQFVRTFEDVASVTQNDLVKAMVGRNVGDVYGYFPRPIAQPRLEVQGLLAPGVKKPADLTARAGEIVGLFGLVGAGRTELLKGIFGGTRPTRGTVRIDGEVMEIKSPIDSIAHGLVFCPEDRKAEGIISIHSVRDNLNISARRNTLRLGTFIDHEWEKTNARKGIKDLNIKTPTDLQLLLNLSGGNQQKVILARWLSEDIKVILLDEPTRGIDVGAKKEIYNVIYSIAAEGKAVVVVSSDLPEILGISDRIVVMRDGAIVGELTHDEATEEKALSLAMVNTEAKVA